MRRRLKEHSMAASCRAAFAAVLTLCLVSNALSCHQHSWTAMLPSASHVNYRQSARSLMGDAVSKVKRVHLGLRRAQQPLSAAKAPAGAVLS